MELKRKLFGIIRRKLCDVPIKIEFKFILTRMLFKFTIKKPEIHYISIEFAD